MKHLTSDKSLTISAAGAKKGAILAVEGVISLVYLLSLPVLIQPVAVIASCALIGAGLTGLRYGAARAWKGLEHFSEAHLPVNPLRRIRLRAARVADKVNSTATVRKIRAFADRCIDRVAESDTFKSALEKPLMKKLLASRAAGLMKKGLNPHQQETFLATVTLHGSITTLAILGYHLARHAGALPLATVGGGVLTAGIVVYLVGTNARSIVHATKSLNRSKKNKNAAELPVCLAPSVEPAPAAALDEKSATAGFNGAALAAKEAAAGAKPVAPAAAPKGPAV